MLNCIFVLSKSPYFIVPKQDKPDPTRMLIKGAAANAVTAISANPFLAMLVFADISPKELPHDRRVRLRRD
jgi:hypothetical protein